MSPVQVNNLVESIKQEIGAINYAKTVVDESNMVNDMSSLRKEDNLLLFGVLPDYESDAKDDEQDSYVLELSFYCVNKTDYGSAFNDKTLALWQNAFEVAKQIKDYFFKLKEEDECGIYSKIDTKTIGIYPVWAYAETNGYRVKVNFKSVII